LALLAGLLLATPYERRERHDLLPPKGAEMEVSLILAGTQHRISIAPAGQPGWIVAEGRGHGIPGSGVKAVWNTRTEPGGESYFQFKQRISGWFTELMQKNEILVPDSAGEVRVFVHSGVAEINLRGVSKPQRWKLEAARGASCQWTAGEDRGQVTPGVPFRWESKPAKTK
jgi:hypothetical protein